MATFLNQIPNGSQTRALRGGNWEDLDKAVGGELNPHLEITVRDVRVPRNSGSVQSASRLNTIYPEIWRQITHGLLPNCDIGRADFIHPNVWLVARNVDFLRKSLSIDTTKARAKKKGRNHSHDPTWERSSVSCIQSLPF